MSNELEPMPSSGLRDWVDSGLRAVLALLPGGGALVELINTVIAPSLERRQKEWFAQLAEVLTEVRSKVEDFDLEQLGDNELFVTAVIEASRIAATTHRSEKLGYLRKVLIRLAVDSDSDEFLAMQMLRFVDTLSPEHFVALKYCADPGGWYDAKGMERADRVTSSRRSLLFGAKLPVTGESLQIVLRDLSELGLVDLEGFDVTGSGNSMWRPLATELGNSLLEFVGVQDQA